MLHTKSKLLFCTFCLRDTTKVEVGLQVSTKSHGTTAELKRHQCTAVRHEMWFHQIPAPNSSQSVQRYRGLLQNLQ